MPLIRYLMVALLLLHCHLVQATESYIIGRVYDGDTVELIGNQGRFKLRLVDIDAPERNQAYGKQSRRALTKLCKGNRIKVTVQTLAIDKYNRNLGNLQCNGIDASMHVIEKGLAWHNKKYSNNIHIAEAEAHARHHQRGLWKSKNPMPPWVWRQKHPH